MGRNTTPSSLTKRRSGTQIRVRVLLLDDQYQTFFVDSKCTGEELFRTVCDELDLLERDFFSLRFQDTAKQLFWLDMGELVRKQLKATMDADCFLCIKYYVAEPCTLREELTRYFFFLQVKRDIFQGRIMVTPTLAAGLLACILQSELGDFHEDDLQPGYVNEFQFLPQPSQTAELEEEAEEAHKALRGLVPADAEGKFLEKAKWLPLYGVDLHPVKGAAGAALQIGISQSGIAVFQNATRVSFFHWPKISKVQFKRKFFIVHVIVNSEGVKPEVLKYKFMAFSERSAKELWRCGVEQHCFFRRIVIDPNVDFSRGGGGLLRSGSKFRYTGRTEFQVRQSMRAVSRDEPRFTRVDSRFFRKSLPPALHLPTVGHHWRSQRGLTINDNPHSKALKQVSKKTMSENQESLYSRLSRPLRRVTVSASVNRQGSPTKQLSSPDSMVAGAAGEGDSPGRSHGKAQRTSSAPSAWLFRTRKSKDPTSDTSTSTTPAAPVYAIPSKRSPNGTTRSWGLSSVDRTQQKHRSTESSQRFTMPWLDAAEGSAHVPHPSTSPHDQNKTKVSELYANHRRHCVYQKSVSDGAKPCTGSADNILAMQDPQFDYSVPRPAHESPPYPAHRATDFSPARTMNASHNYRGSPGVYSTGAFSGRGEGSCYDDTLSGVVSVTGVPRNRLVSSGSGVGDWPWMRTDTPVGDNVSDAPIHEAEYLQEDIVSDEAHKRYMQKLWNDMAHADSPPPTDLAIKPKVVTRHISASAIKARRIGSRSAVLSGSPAEKVLEGALNSHHNVSCENSVTDGTTDRHAMVTSLLQPGFSDTLPAVPRRVTASGDRRRNFSAKDRRASVLGVQLFSSMSPTLPPTSEADSAAPRSKPFSASSDDGDHGVVMRQKKTSSLDRQSSDDVMETSGTFEMISPLQRRVSDLNSGSTVHVRGHEKLKTKRSLPLHLSAHRDDDDLGEGGESDFDDLPGMTAPNNIQGQTPRHQNCAPINNPIIASLKAEDINSCKPALGRVTSFGSAMSDDVFAVEPDLTSHLPVPAENGHAGDTAEEVTPEDPHWFESG